MRTLLLILAFLTLSGVAFGQTSSTDPDPFIQVTPNPAKDHVNIYFEDFSSGEVTVSLINLIGKEEFKRTVSVTNGHMVYLDLKSYDLKKGIYFIRVKSADKLINKKLLIQ